MREFFDAFVCAVGVVGNGRVVGVPRSEPFSDTSSWCVVRRVRTSGREYGAARDAAAWCAADALRATARCHSVSRYGNTSETYSASGRSLLTFDLSFDL
jgi:hypothetical protein